MEKNKETGVTPRVLSTRSRLPGGGLNRLADRFDLVRPAANRSPDRDELLDLATGVDAILALTPDRPGAALLAAAGPSLRVISLASMGFDGVDLAAAADRGVVVTNTPDVLAETTADLAFALILMARRRLLVAADSLRAGHWDAFRMDGYLGLDVYGSTIGLIGYGQIAKAVARRAVGFGMRVLHHTRTPGAADGISVAVDLPTLLAESDVVSVHVPLSPATRGLIGAKELAAMKPTATLVNTARGGIVDEDALLDALERGAIASAGLNVFAKEPLGAGCFPAGGIGQIGAVAAYRLRDREHQSGHGRCRCRQHHRRPVRAAGPEPGSGDARPLRRGRGSGMSAHRLFDISGRIALITGSSRGIGKALAHGLAEAGATVVLNGRDRQVLSATRDELIEKTGGTVVTQAFDVTNPAEVVGGVARIEDEVGPLEILINNTEPSTAARWWTSRTRTGTGCWTPT